MSDVQKPVPMPRATVDQIALANAVWNLLGIKTAEEFQTWLGNQMRSDDHSEDWKK